MQIERIYRDPARLCPMPAGPALLDGTKWTVRLAHGDASIEAPRALLQRMVTACDGSRSMAQIVDETRPASLRARIGGFIDDLLNNGVLVDASLFTVAAQRFAWIPSPLGNAVEKPVWREVPLRFDLTDPAALPTTGRVDSTPLDSLLEQRRSLRTFDDTGSLEESALRSYLWLLAGIVQVPDEQIASGPRRTIPSGGAVHALRPMLVLRRAVGPWQPGVYAVRYPAARHVELERVHADAGWLPRAVSHPWYLTHATGMVFLVADPRLGAIKYRGRALQYLFTEAGAALQNAALAAPSLGIGMSVYGGYIETAASSGLHLQSHDIVIASAMFGRMPTPAQQLLAARSLRVDFAWVDAPSDTYAPPGNHIARCRLEVEGSPPHESWGRDSDPWLALVKSTVELIERTGFRTPQRIELGRIGDWPNVLDPRDVVRYSAAQYRSREFPFKPFDERAKVGWVEGCSLGDGARVKVLAELVYSAKVLREQWPGAFAGYSESNSSGCGAHLDSERAIEAGLFELIERDAYMRSWFTQQPGIGIATRSLPAALRRRMEALEAHGCTVSLQCLPSPWAPVCVVYAQHEARHFTVVGAGARYTLAEASAAALDEMETLAYVNFNEPDKPIPRPREVKVPMDHTLLYASARHFRRADALLQPMTMSTLGRLARGREFDGSVAQRLVDAGQRVVVVDITAPGSAIDQGRTPVHVVRTLAPGLLPMSFGYGREPLGMVDKIDPRARFPHPFP